MFPLAALIDRLHQMEENRLEKSARETMEPSQFHQWLREKHRERQDERRHREVIQAIRES